MQPDLLSVEREEERLEALSPGEGPQSETQFMPEAAQLKDNPIVEVPESKPALPTQKKRSGWIFAAIGLVLLVFFLFLGFGWVGYWAYTLNTELTTAQSELAALQAKHHKLQADYTTLTSESEKLNADLTQSKTDLEKATSGLATAQADLDRSKAQNNDLNTQINKAGKLAEILYVISISDNESGILKIDRLVNEAGNKELTKQWDAFTTSPSEDGFTAFLDYLIFATRESLR